MIYLTAQLLTMMCIRKFGQYNGFCTFAILDTDKSSLHESLNRKIRPRRNGESPSYTLAFVNSVESTGAYSYVMKNRTGRKISHGFAIRGEKKIKEYHSWQHMKRRCHDPKHFKYQSYGAKGIKVCERWRNSFADFLQDVGYAPSPAHTIDRIDNNGNYEPGNVRWATPIEQSRNTKKNRMLSHDGKNLCVSEWAELLGAGQGSIFYRLSRGWSVYDTLTVPFKIRSKK